MVFYAPTRLENKGSLTAYVKPYYGRCLTNP